MTYTVLIDLKKYSDVDIIDWLTANVGEFNSEIDGKLGINWNIKHVVRDTIMAMGGGGGGGAITFTGYTPQYISGGGGNTNSSVIPIIHKPTHLEVSLDYEEHYVEFSLRFL